MILLGLILTQNSEAAEENSEKKISCTEWSDYQRRTIGDYIIFTAFFSDETGEVGRDAGRKFLINKNDFKNNKSCFQETVHYNTGQKYKEHYIYSDNAGFYASSSYFLLEAIFPPYHYNVLADSIWIKVIDYNNNQWIGLDSNYVDVQIGDGITFNGNLKIHGVLGLDDVVTVAGIDYQCKRSINYIDVTGIFKKGSETFEMNSYRMTTTAFSGKNAGLIKWNFSFPKHNSPWFGTVLTGTGGIATQIHRQTVDVEDNIVKSNSVSISPNPFSESTSINYELQTPGRVKIDIFNSLGEKITTLVDEWQEAGKYNYELRIKNYELSAGMYYYRMQIGNRFESGKLLLIK